MDIQNALKKSALIGLVLGSVIFTLSIIIYFLPAGAITKISTTNLTIDPPLAFSFQIENSSDVQSQEHSQDAPIEGKRTALVVAHQYIPPRIIVFRGRHYDVIPGFEYSFDARNAERLDIFNNIPFITRPKEDLISPITALF